MTKNEYREACRIRGARYRKTITYKKYYRKSKKYKVIYHKRWRKKNKLHLKKFYKAKKKERQRMINEIKESFPCKDCKKFFPAICMDLDHVRGKKIAALSVMVAKRRAKHIMEKEIEKCDVVCSNCHRLRTQKRGYK